MITHRPLPTVFADRIVISTSKLRILYHSIFHDLIDDHPPDVVMRALPSNSYNAIYCGYIQVEDEYIHFFIDGYDLLICIEDLDGNADCLVERITKIRYKMR